MPHLILLNKDIFNRIGLKFKLAIYQNPLISMNLHSWVKVELTLKINILRYLLSRKPRARKDNKRFSQSVISCFGDNSIQRNTLE